MAPIKSSLMTSKDSTHTSTNIVNTVSMKNLTKRYLFKQALNGLNLTFEPGQIVGLLGPNGSGKTTLMRILTGLIRPSGGVVTVDGLPVGKNTRDLVAYMPTESHLYDNLTVEQCVDLFQTFYKNFDRQKAMVLLNRMGFETQLKQRIQTLSTGQKARIKVAITLSRKAKIYLFDEPLNGIDPISRDMVLELLAEQVNEDSTLVISSHLVNEFEGICDVIVFIREGQLELKGETDALRAEHNKSIHDLYKEVYQYA